MIHCTYHRNKAIVISSCFVIVFLRFSSAAVVAVFRLGHGHLSSSIPIRVTSHEGDDANGVRTLVDVALGIFAVVQRDEQYERWW